MSDLTFRWDPEKDALNQGKHGVPFEETKSVLYDENARLIEDPDHSEEVDRFILLGFGFSLRLLVVCPCYRDKESVIRIISARKATKSEARKLSEVTMRQEYDFSKSIKNPYAKRLKKQITIRLDED